MKGNASQKTKCKGNFGKLIQIVDEFIAINYQTKVKKIFMFSFAG